MLVCPESPTPAADNLQFFQSAYARLRVPHRLGGFLEAAGFGDVQERFVALVGHIAPLFA